MTTCPKPDCDGVLIRIISPPGFNFKGGKPSEEIKKHRVSNRDISIHQTEEGHWEQGGIMDKR